MKTLQIRYDAFGEPVEVLRPVLAAREPLRPGEVLVRMSLSPINPSDLIPVRGAYAHRITLPQVAGYEGVGVVVAAGADADSRLIGQRVLPLRGEGTWQQLVASPAVYAVPVADELGDEAAAQLYINPLTAWLFCRRWAGEEGKRDRFWLVNAGGSALGLLLAQLAERYGFRLIAVTRSARHTEALMRLGAWHVIMDETGSGLPEAVASLTRGRGVDVAVDSVGGTAGAAMARCIRPHGRLVTVGLLSGIPVDWRRIPMADGVRVELFHLRHWLAQATNETWQDAFRQLTALVRSGALRIGPGGSRYALAQVADAVSAAERGGSGKVLLTCNEPPSPERG